ncbi:hypothetical protein D3C72_1248250 [compost metagenome]
MVMSSLTPSKIVGPTKLPCSKPDTFRLRPSSSSLAPSSTPFWIRLSTRFLALGDTSGPRSASRSVPELTLSFLERSTKSGSQLRASPTSTATDEAMQRWPAAPKAAPTSWFSATSGSASGRITQWFLAPIIDWQRLPAADARL